MNFTIDIRPRRQATLPSELLDYMGLSVGDTIDIFVKNRQIIMKPKKQVALDALTAIQAAFFQSPVKETQLQKLLEKQRFMNE